MEQALIALAERYVSQHYNLINLYDTMCGKIYNKKHKTFLIDLDEEDLSKKILF